MKNLTKTAIMIADGTYHDVYSLQRSTFTLENIAIALGNTCRWGGHLGQVKQSNFRDARPIRAFEKGDTKLVSNFYSVAEHSVLGAQYHMHNDEDDLARLFMLHDAGEPYIGGDIATPLKNELPTVSEWEKDIQDVLIDCYSLKGSFKDIKETDIRMCRNETIGLFEDKAEWALGIEPLCFETGFNRTLINLKKWSPEQAMNEWYKLAIKLGLENQYV